MARWGALLRRSARRLCSTTTRERLDYDVVIVGAGPAGLSAAIRLRQLNNNISVCVLEKGAEVGAHILSGNVFEPRAIDEFLPDWRESAPTGVPVTSEKMMYLTQSNTYRLPVPPALHNDGNYVLSLSQLVRWLGEVAEEVGVEIYPGFSASEVLYENGRVIGVATNDFGVGKDGRRKENFEPGIEITGKISLLAEGARGSLSKSVITRFGLAAKSQPQTYGLGVKEVWRVPESLHRPGHVEHAIGYPLDSKTYGGSFLYHMSENCVSLGLITALDYTNPYLSPYQEFQKWKNHPSVRPLLENGEVLQYGARVINEGGYQSVPRLEFPGGALIGCSAGFVNVAKIKGTHTAMKSATLAAEIAARSLNASDDGGMDGYEQAVRNSWVGDELWRIRNVRPAFKYGLAMGVANAAFETYVARGRAPWTIGHGVVDNAATRKAEECRKIEYPAADGKVTFDILTALANSGTNHDHDERCHLTLKDESVPNTINLPVYGAPESRYCPAKVYEYVESEDGMRLQINAQNCLHCKACDVKDPTQNINWTVPQGGGGPKYTVS